MPKQHQHYINTTTTGFKGQRISADLDKDGEDERFGRFAAAAAGGSMRLDDGAVLVVLAVAVGAVVAQRRGEGAGQLGRSRAHWPVAERLLRRPDLALVEEVHASSGVSLVQAP